MKNRLIRKYGNSYIIRLSPIDVKDYNIEMGDYIDLEPSLFLYSQEKQKRRIIKLIQVKEEQKQWNKRYMWRYERQATS
jgi:antitoxin component of MazEF toxin-antitoxin module